MLFILCPLWRPGGVEEDQASDVDMVITLGQGWEDGVDAILKQYCEGSILGPTTVIKSGFQSKGAGIESGFGRFGPAHSDQRVTLSLGRREVCQENCGRAGKNRCSRRGFLPPIPQILTF